MLRMADNTLILVDYDNVFVTLKNNYRNFKNPNIMYDVISKLREKYVNDNILSVRLFADFQRVQISDVGYDILRKNHVEIEHVFNGKNASDVILMLNCMKYMMQYPHINKIILVSSDSDLIPIFHEVQLLNKKLEVLYFEVNTSDEHINHMEEANIPHSSIEKLMSIPKYQEYPCLDDFYNSKIAVKDDFAEFLVRINDIIADAYDKHLQKDAFGNVISAGFMRFSELIEKMKELGLCPENEFRKSSGSSYTNIINMLQDKQILIEHKYSIDGKSFNTQILSEQYLSTEGIVIDNLVKAKDFPNT